MGPLTRIGVDAILSEENGTSYPRKKPQMFLGQDENFLPLAARIFSTSGKRVVKRLPMTFRRIIFLGIFLGMSFLGDLQAVWGEDGNASNSGANVETTDEDESPFEGAHKLPIATSTRPPGSVMEESGKPRILEMDGGKDGGLLDSPDSFGNSFSVGSTLPLTKEDLRIIKNQKIGEFGEILGKDDEKKFPPILAPSRRESLMAIIDKIRGRGMLPGFRNRGGIDEIHPLSVTVRYWYEPYALIIKKDRDGILYIYDFEEELGR